MSITRQLGAIAAALWGALIVVDGDTVKQDGVTYRLLNFDTPETFYARCDQELQLGNRAAARLRELVTSDETRLEPNGKKCAWGRECARLIVNGEDVGDVLIREGLAVPWRRGDAKHDWCR